MQVSVRRVLGPTGSDIAMVAFEFGSVRDPHEFLQDEARTRVWFLSEAESKDDVAREISIALMDKHRGLLGRRGNLWVNPEDHEDLAAVFNETARDQPWDPKQVMDPATLLWIAKRVPAAHFRVPALVGLNAGDALHEAVQQAVLLQGAFRALELNKDFRASSRKPPRGK